MSAHYKRWFWILVALFIPTAIGLARIDLELRSVHAPLRIISFEFCGFTSSCAAMLDDWGAAGREWVMLLLGLDYLFMVAYAGLLWFGLMLAAGGSSARMQSMTRLIAAGAIAAALADAIENYALIQLVTGGDMRLHGMMAGIFASVKFALVALALVAWAGLGLRRMLVRGER